MLHQAATPSGKDPAASYKMKLGVYMFFLYLLFYIGFVAINLLSPISMEAIVFMGLNLVTVYGFSLIIGALILAFIYDGFCRRKEQQLSTLQNNEKEV